MTQAAEQFLASAKTAVADLGEIAAKNMAAFEKLVELNMATAKSAVADSAEQMQAAFAARTPQDLSSAAELVKPMADKATAYGKAVAGIVTEAGAALSKSAEAKFADLQAQALANIDAAMKHAPAGSETAVAPPRPKWPPRPPSPARPSKTRASPAAVWRPGPPKECPACGAFALVRDLAAECAPATHREGYVIQTLIQSMRRRAGEGTARRDNFDNKRTAWTGGRP